MWGYIEEFFSEAVAPLVPSLYVRVYRWTYTRGGTIMGSLIICEGISDIRGRLSFPVPFPHYMWGYIVSVIVSRIISAVPSLYVRVYRIPYAARMSHMCSLIICEGISAKAADIGANCTFPHYMWGYIASARHQPRSGRVPSLYVRVYRPSNERYGPEGSSLIICEGISDYGTMKTEEPEFPHYMWGYIVLYMAQLCNNIVPSLYVRVYRFQTCRKAAKTCSLIICEGISERWLCVDGHILFPHYMWGYIGHSWGEPVYESVPSLYVRVYREILRALFAAGCSLIICEGISRFFIGGRPPTSFPHYMWGYIGSSDVTIRFSEVPSLYVRVYRLYTAQFILFPSSLIICEGISPREEMRARRWLFPHYMWGYIEIGNGILQASKKINIVHDSIPQIA